MEFKENLRPLSWQQGYLRGSSELVGIQRLD